MPTDPLRAAEQAGSEEPFADPELYDWEYRRRRHDVRFYLRLADERRSDAGPRPILDLACGSGRLLIPLLRAGHAVVGFDLSRPMLDRAAWRLRHLSAPLRRQALLFQADLRGFATQPQRFSLAICAFHSIQHIFGRAALLSFFRRVRRTLAPDGWFAFDVLPLAPSWQDRAEDTRWGRTVFTHPVSRQRFVYTTNHTPDPRRRTLHTRFYYQPIDANGQPAGDEKVVRLCHRQLSISDIGSALRQTGFQELASFGGFDGRPLEEGAPDCLDQHIFVARPRRP